MNKQLLLSSVSGCEPQTDTSIFRPIHYLGSKFRLANYIREAIDEVDPSNGRVCDLFAGSGTVANILSPFRPVTSVDIQEYSRVLCSAVLSPASLRKEDLEILLSETHSSLVTQKLLWAFEPLINYENKSRELALNGNPEPLAEILEKGSLEVFRQGLSAHRSRKYQKATINTLDRLSDVKMFDSQDSITTRYFGGIYFSFYQSVKIDSFLGFAQSVNTEHKDTVTSAALSTASLLVNTIGKQFAQPLRPRTKEGQIKNSFVDKVEKDRNMDATHVFRLCLEKFFSLPQSNFEHSAIAGDYLKVLKDIGHELTCVYADPPYTRDHYSRYYHVLETMCRRDNPSISIVKKNGKETASKGIYRVDRHQSSFCIRSQALPAFKDLFKLVQELGIPLVLSYSPHEEGDETHPRVVSTTQILGLAKRYFSHVEVVTIKNFAHSRLNSNIHRLPSRENAELIIKCYAN